MNPENLIGKGFDARPENINTAGKKPGTKNRATVLKELIALSLTRNNLDDVPVELSTEAHVINSLLRKALDGDVPAIKEVQDTLHGKIADLHGNADGSNLAPTSVILNVNGKEKK